MQIVKACRSEEVRNGLSWWKLLQLPVHDQGRRNLGANDVWRFYTVIGFSWAKTNLMTLPNIFWLINFCRSTIYMTFLSVGMFWYPMSISRNVLISYESLYQCFNILSISMAMFKYPINLNKLPIYIHRKNLRT